MKVVKKNKNLVCEQWKESMMKWSKEELIDLIKMNMTKLKEIKKIVKHY